MSARRTAPAGFKTTAERVAEMCEGRHPASCDHIWAVAVSGQVCANCGAVCRRDDAGKICFYDAFPLEGGSK